MKVVWNPRSSAARKIRPLLVPLFLFGCTSTYVTPPPPVYTPPEPRPAVTVELISNSDFESTWSALIEYTASTSFSIDEFERESGLMTLSFSTADPKTIVDVVECGQWAVGGGAPVPYVGRTNFSLRTRTNLIVQPISTSQTRVRANTLYVLQDDSNTEYRFTTNESATAQPRNRAAGTARTRTCQATHEGERAFSDGVRQALR